VYYVGLTQEKIMNDLKYSIVGHGHELDRATVHDSGMDIKSNEDVIVYHGLTRVVSTGIHLLIPAHEEFPFKTFEVQIRSRSGMAAKRSIHVLSSPGTVDFSYTGELKIILHNSGVNHYKVCDGDKIAQLVMSEVILNSVVRIDNEQYKDEAGSLQRLSRGSKGLGSSGK
jgi:dUTP pyrophosphatase